MENKLSQLDRIEYNIKFNRIINWSCYKGILGVLCVILMFLTDGFGALAFLILSLVCLFQSFYDYSKRLKKLNDEFFTIELKPYKEVKNGRKRS